MVKKLFQLKCMRLTVGSGPLHLPLAGFMLGPNYIRAARWFIFHNQAYNNEKVVSNRSIAVVPNLGVNYPRGVICDSSVGNVTPPTR